MSSSTTRGKNHHKHPKNTPTAISTGAAKSHYAVGLDGSPRWREEPVGPPALVQGPEVEERLPVEGHPQVVPLAETAHISKGCWALDRVHLKGTSSSKGARCAAQLSRVLRNTHQNASPVDELALEVIEVR